MAKLLQFAGSDYGVFVFGRSILAKNPHACLAFFYDVTPSNSESVQSEDAYWPKNLPAETGVMFDHHRQDISDWAQSYRLFPTQALHHLANEGLADSIEFRRLARKFIRRAKQANCQHLFFPEAIFAETKTQKVLQHIAGSQLKVLTLNDFILENNPVDAGEIKIFHALKDVSFLQSRAEKILGRKLKPSNFELI